MKTRLEAAVLEGKSLVTLTLRGALTGPNKSKARFYFNELVTNEAPCVALDLEKLEKVDAGGLSVLTDFIRTLTRKNVPLYAYGMSDEIYDILDVVDFRGNLTLLPDKAAFLRVFKQSISKTS